MATGLTRIPCIFHHLQCKNKLTPYVVGDDDDAWYPSANAQQLVIDEIRAHHAELAGRLHELSWTVLAAAKHATNGGDWVADREALHTWYRDELLPHIVAEEQALYSVAAELDATRLLICSMLTEHRSLVSLLADLALASEPFEAAVSAATAQALLTGHLGKENDLLLPALDTLGVELAVVLGGMHDLLGSATPAAVSACGCGCGHDDSAGSVAPVSVETSSAAGQASGELAHREA